MNASPPTQLLLAGLPGAGKTTFVAALWHVVQSGEVEGALQLVRLQDETEYLSRIYKAWSQFQPLKHTQVGTVEPITLVLHDAVGQEAQISFPDVSGESFQSVWSQRHWDETMAVLIEELDGLLLFLRPDETPRERTLAETHDLANAVFPDDLDKEEPEIDEDLQADEDVNDETPESEYKPYEPRLASKQAQVVEMLQAVQGVRRRETPLRVSVVISAWDIAEKNDPKLSPNEWLAAQMPLASQFLKANRATLHTHIWGLSAQGGDLEDADDLQRLQANFEQSRRIKVVGGPQNESGEHDITAPIRWVMSDSKLKTP